MQRGFEWRVAQTVFELLNRLLCRRTKLSGRGGNDGNEVANLHLNS